MAEVACAECGDELPAGRQRYCTRECADRAGHRRRHRRKRADDGRLSRIESEARALQALRMNAVGMGWGEVARQLGYGSPYTARDAAERALQRAAHGPVKDLVETEVAASEWIIREMLDCVQKPSYVVSTTGKLVYGPDGEPLADLPAKSRMLTNLDKAVDRRAKLRNAYPAEKHHVTVASELDQQIEETLGQLNAAARQREEENRRLRAQLRGLPGGDVVDAEIVP